MLKTGAVAPDFELLDQDGLTRNLASNRGSWVVLYFYPRDDTPGCTKEACAFRDGVTALARLDAVVLGISADDVASHKAFAGKY
ncbi:MAG TPA: peroxiredoxin, partial [Trueperaceae bacterium]|nr:peroxiredoxin [Trueperaceae bacterium]